VRRQDLRRRLRNGIVRWVLRRLRVVRGVDERRVDERRVDERRADERRVERVVRRLLEYVLW
jgi:hypothetical protein